MVHDSWDNIAHGGRKLDSSKDLSDRPLLGPSTFYLARSTDSQTVFCVNQIC